jgi:NADH-quinone oxidoreductase subunit D
MMELARIADICNSILGVNTGITTGFLYVFQGAKITGYEECAAPPHHNMGRVERYGAGLFAVVIQTARLAEELSVVMKEFESMFNRNHFHGPRGERGGPISTEGVKLRLPAPTACGRASTTMCA